MKKTKDYIDLILKAYMDSTINKNEALDYIISSHKETKIFNWNSFYYGTCVGMIIALLVLHFTSII